MSDTYNISVAASTTIANNTTITIEKTFVDSQEEEKENLLGPLLGAGVLIAFAIAVVYLLVRRGELRKEKEATREEENRRLFLRKHIDIKTYSDCSSGHIDDEEAQEEETISGVGNGERDDCCSTASIHDNKEEEIPHIDMYIEEAQSFEDEKICLICHEQFQAGDEIASSRNDVCCHSIFHSECIISWLMTDHRDCPLCRNTFLVLKRMTSKKK